MSDDDDTFGLTFEAADQPLGVMLRLLGKWRRAVLDVAAAEGLSGSSVDVRTRIREGSIVADTYVGATSRNGATAADFARINASFVHGLRSLQRESWPTGWPESAIEALASMKPPRHAGPVNVRYGGRSAPAALVAARAQALIVKRDREDVFAPVARSGRVEKIDVHGNVGTFDLFPAMTPERGVKCVLTGDLFADDDLVEQIGGSVRHDIEIVGDGKFRDGRLIEITVRSVRVLEQSTFEPEDFVGVLEGYTPAPWDGLPDAAGDDEAGE